MLAIGCFLPLATLAAGAVVGSYAGAERGGYWGAAAGLAAGLLVVAIGLFVLNRARKGG
jgi:thiol:disulfide interchange protein